jgi:hypothetical protein
VHPPINCFGKVIDFWCLLSPLYFKLFVVMLAIWLGLRFLNCSLFEEKNSNSSTKTLNFLQGKPYCEEYICFGQWAPETYDENVDSMQHETV